jgi:hypothetical protein
MSDLTDQLDTIQKRAEADRSDFDLYANIGTDQCIEDREFLLDLASKQQAALDALLWVADNKAAKETHVGRWWASVIRSTIEKHTQAKP